MEFTIKMYRAVYFQDGKCVPLQRLLKRADKQLQFFGFGQDILQNLDPKASLLLVFRPTDKLLRRPIGIVIFQVVAAGSGCVARVEFFYFRHDPLGCKISDGIFYQTLSHLYKALRKLTCEVNHVQLYLPQDNYYSSYYREFEGEPHEIFLSRRCDDLDLLQIPFWSFEKLIKFMLESA